MTDTNDIDWQQLAEQIKGWGAELGFQQLGIADVDLGQHQQYLKNWLDKGYHGEMTFMAQHGTKRSRPDELLPGTLRVISVRLDYLPTDAAFARNLKDKSQGYISRYALGRDYHKLMRNKLKKLGEKIKQHCKNLNFRPFVDSAPVLEHAIAEKAGIGWTGKHSLTLNKQAGSWFFLGELFVNLPLPTDQKQTDHCGNCNACMTICPTNAIVEPYVVDARRCISYLTIEIKGAIPEQYRPLIGNRIYGCDDCQLICPWNRFATLSSEPDFSPRSQLRGQSLINLFSWDEATFLKHTEGSAIRRIGHERWQRNIAVALGNAPFDTEIVKILEATLPLATPMLAEHIKWALKQQQARQRTTKVEVNRGEQRLIRSIEKGLPRDA